MDCADWASVSKAAHARKFDPGDEERRDHEEWARGKRRRPDRDVACDQKLLSILTGYSLTTINRVLHGERGIVQETRARAIRRLAEDLGYVLPKRAQLPKRSWSATIAVGVEFLDKPSFSYHEEIIRSLSEALGPRGRLFLFDMSEPARYAFFREPPRLADCDGLVLVNTQASAAELGHLAAAYPALPVVLIHDNRPPDDAYPAPVVANVFPDLESEGSGYRKLLRHVLEEHGVTAPLLAMVKAGAVQTRQIKKRMFREEVRRHGLQGQVYEKLPAYTVAAGRELAEEIGGRDVDALVCLADVVAVGALSQLGPAGRVLVTGFDNNDLADAFSFSSVDQNLGETGREAVKALQEGIEAWQRSGDRSCRTVLVRTEAVLRCCAP
jgi:DNA-binding LacI/PurR family transcriptional regulator